MDRTLAQAERDYDRALADGAAAVSVMQEKLQRQTREANHLLAAAVLSMGGRVEIMNRALLDGFDAVLTIEDNPQIGGITVVVTRK